MRSSPGGGFKEVICSSEGAEESFESGTSKTWKSLNLERRKADYREKEVRRVQ